MTKRAVLGVVAVVVLWLIVGAGQVYAASRDLESARQNIDALRDVDLDSDLAAVRDDLDRATASFEQARRRLGGIGTLPLRFAPVVGDDLVVLRELSAAGAAAGEAGGGLLGAVADLPGGAGALAPNDGRLPVDAYEQLAEPLQQAEALLGRAERHLKGTQGVAVNGRIVAAREALSDQLPELSESVGRASALVQHLPEFLGSSQPRRYLFLAQNPAEARGTGGFIGAYSILTADRGRLSFTEVDEIQSLPAYPVSRVIAPSADYARRYNKYGGAGFWHNINLTPDFPTAARAMLALYEKGKGERLDGVIATDPFALEALLEVSTPIDVPGFGTVGADDVVEVISHRAHAEIDDSRRRKQLLGAVAIGAFQGVLNGSGDPVDVVRALADTAGEGHVQLQSAEADEQAAFVKSGIAGALENPDGDFLAVVGNAGSAAKLDYYLRRTLTYDVELLPDGRSRSQATIAIRNDAPPNGISHRVIGPNVDGLEAGEQRLILSTFAGSGATLRAAKGATGKVDEDTENGHPVFTSVEQIPPGASRQLSLDWERERGWEQIGEGGRYHLTVQGQTVLRPTEIGITVTLPPGMRMFAASDGVEELDDGRLGFSQELGRRTTIDVLFGP